MRLHGQRWQFRIDNHVVNVDNAFSWLGWAQERFLVNEESVQATGQWFAFRRTFKEPWLTRLGEDELHVEMRSTMVGIACHVTLSGERLEPDTLYQHSWHGKRHSWPPGEEWKETDTFLWEKFDLGSWWKT